MPGTEAIIFAKGQRRIFCSAAVEAFQQIIYTIIEPLLPHPLTLIFLAFRF